MINVYKILIDRLKSLAAFLDLRVPNAFKILMAKQFKIINIKPGRFKAERVL